mgnify:CR=1 FL=1
MRGGEGGGVGRIRRRGGVGKSEGEKDGGRESMGRVEREGGVKDNGAHVEEGCNFWC